MKYIRFRNNSLPAMKIISVKEFRNFVQDFEAGRNVGIELCVNGKLINPREAMGRNFTLVNGQIHLDARSAAFAIVTIGNKKHLCFPGILEKEGKRHLQRLYGDFEIREPSPPEIIIPIQEFFDEFEPDLDIADLTPAELKAMCHEYLDDSVDFERLVESLKLVEGIGLQCNDLPK